MPKLKANQFILSGHLITERPILYQTEMVQANMEDRKTQTRRILKIKGCKAFIPTTPEEWDLDTIKKWNKEYYPYGKPGDLLWVRETWHLQKASGQFPDLPNERYYSYKADHPDRNPGPMWPPFDGWKPSIHMPKSAARIWLMVEDVRVERVQQISEEDALKEGINSWFEPLFQEYRFKDYTNRDSNWRNPSTSFHSLWTSINGKASWDTNPWVWVIKYRILSKTGRPNNEAILKNYLDITGKEAHHD